VTVSTVTALLAAYRRHLTASRGLASATTRNYLADLAPFFEYLLSQELDLRQEATGLRRFIEQHGPEGVAREYRNLVRDYVSWLLERRQLRAGSRAGQRGHQRASVMRCLAALRSLFRYLIEHGLAPDSPIWAPQSGLMRQFTPKAHRRLPDIVTATEAARLVEAPQPSVQRLGQARTDALALRDHALLEILYGSGLRVSEAAGLNVDDLSLKERTVRITGKGRKTRMVPIGKASAQALKDYLRTGRAGLLKAGHSSSGLFASRRGSRMSVRSIQATVRRYAAVAGLRDGVHPHTLRHSYATHLLDGGADLRVVQELLGHTTPSATQVYTHISQVEARRVYLAAHPLAKTPPAHQPKRGPRRKSTSKATTT
jgi:site-specific recombinase XerD